VQRQQVCVTLSKTLQVLASSTEGALLLRHWHNCPGVVGSPSLEVFQSRRDVALGEVVMGMVGWFGVGLDDLRGLFHP